MKRVIFILCAAMMGACAVWAQNSVITYTASSKLAEYKDLKKVLDFFNTHGLHTDQFDVPIQSHSFENGQGTITFAGELTSIKTCAFGGCWDMTSVTIPRSVTRIYAEAFKDCRMLPVKDGLRYADTYVVEVVNKKKASYTIQEGTTGIADEAFKGCNQLVSITIPRSVTHIGGNAFKNCISLTDIQVDPDNTAYSSQDGVLYTKGQDTLIKYPKANPRTEFVIPNRVTQVEDEAFDQCMLLNSVVVPSSVTDIGKRAFQQVNHVIYQGTADYEAYRPYWGAKCINGYVEGNLIYQDATKTTLCGCSSAEEGEVIGL